MAGNQYTTNIILLAVAFIFIGPLYYQGRALLFNSDFRNLSFRFLVIRLRLEVNNEIFHLHDEI